jgi:hypothetical protein
MEQRQVAGARGVNVRSYPITDKMLRCRDSPLWANGRHRRPLEKAPHLAIVPIREMLLTDGYGLRSAGNDRCAGWWSSFVGLLGADKRNSHFSAAAFHQPNQDVGVSAAAIAEVSSS